MRLSKYLKRLANDEARKKRNEFNDFMKENGWVQRILFMRGTKWVKDSDEITIGISGYYLNGTIVSKDDVYKFVGYKNEEE